MTNSRPSSVSLSPISHPLMSNEPSNYHSSYTFPDADLVLCTNDAVRFRVHSSIMKLASGVFRSMLEIPRATNEGCEEPIPVHDLGVTVAHVLDIIYPHGVWNRNVSVETMTQIARFAEMYDMPKVTACLRDSFRQHQSLKDQPLEMYALACHHGWEEEAKVASTETLRLDLTAADLHNQLASLSTENLLRLQALHRCRAEKILMVMRAFFMSGHHSTCGEWKLRQFITMDQPWSYLEYHVSREMQRFPDGSVLKNPAFWDQAAFSNIWETPCEACGCIRPSKAAMRDGVIAGIENSIPTAVLGSTRRQ